MLKRIVSKWLVLGAFVAMLAAVGGWFGLSHASVRTSGKTLLADSASCAANGASFCVSSPSPGPVLYPGASASSVQVSFSNPISVPILVSSLTVSLSNHFPTGCSPAWFTVNGTPLPSGSPSMQIPFSTPLQVPAAGSGGPGSLSIPISLALSNLEQNQDSCQSLPLALSYSASAAYTVPTVTSLSLSPSTDGQQTTLTASVAANISPVSAGATPTGSVQFYECSTQQASSCTTPLGSAPLAGGVASIQTSFSPLGNYNVEAVYKPLDPTSFSPSSSPVGTQTVQGCETPPTTHATSVITGVYQGNLEVKAGTSVWLNGGTIKGNVTVDAGGEFDATGGSVTGNVQSSTGPVALSGTSVQGNVQTSGGLFLGPGTNVQGNVQVQGGGPLCSDGNALAQGSVQIGGNLQSQQMTSSAQSSVCGTSVGGNLQWQQNASPALIGACTPNKITGNLQVQNNTGSVTVSNNSTGGNVQVQNNTGGGTLTSNSTPKNCQLSGDSPGILGTQNTAQGQNTCNTTSQGA